MIFRAEIDTKVFLMRASRRDIIPDDIIISMALREK